MDSPRALHAQPGFPGREKAAALVGEGAGHIVSPANPWPAEATTLPDQHADPGSQPHLISIPGGQKTSREHSSLFPESPQRTEFSQFPPPHGGDKRPERDSN